MNQQEIETIVTEILVEELAITENEITLDSTFKDLGADSLDEMEIMIHIEKEFHITIPEEAATRLHDVRGLCKYIEDKLH
ncbi:MAG: acyl carrier protein [Paludibacter sp.]